LGVLRHLGGTVGEAFLGVKLVGELLKVPAVIAGHRGGDGQLRGSAARRGGRAERSQEALRHRRQPAMAVPGLRSTGALLLVSPGRSGFAEGDARSSSCLDPGAMSEAPTATESRVKMSA